MPSKRKFNSIAQKHMSKIGQLSCLETYTGDLGNLGHFELLG